MGSKDVNEGLANMIRTIAALENIGIKPTNAALAAGIDVGHLRRIRNAEIDPKDGMILRLEKLLHDETAKRFRALAELALAEPTSPGMVRAIEPSARHLAAVLATALARIDAQGWPGGDTGN